jgi:hypothetical protein
MRTSTSALPNRDPHALPTLPDTAKVVAWGLVFWGGVQLAALTFERNALAMVAVQAGLAEWGAARMGIAWSPVPSQAKENASPARRAMIGAALGVSVAACCVLVSTLLGTARFAGIPGPGVLAIGLVVAALTAVRDELLLRGVVVRATRLLPAAATLVVCGLAAAAARLGSDGRFTTALIPEALRGVALGAIWVRDRGAWMACAANAGWSWATGVSGSDLLEGGPSTEGMATMGVLALAAFAASVWALRPRTARQAP